METAGSATPRERDSVPNRPRSRAGGTTSSDLAALGHLPQRGRPCLAKHPGGMAAGRISNSPSRVDCGGLLVLGENHSLCPYCGDLIRPCCARPPSPEGKALLGEASRRYGCRTNKQQSLAGLPRGTVFVSGRRSQPRPICLPTAHQPGRLARPDRRCWRWGWLCRPSGESAARPRRCAARAR